MLLFALSLYSLDHLLDGNLTPLVDALASADTAERLARDGD